MAILHYRPPLGHLARTTEEPMKFIHSVIAALALASFVLPATAQIVPIVPAEFILYRFSGVTNQQNAGNPLATSFHCTNFSGATESIRFVTRNSAGGFTTNKAFPIAHLQTITASTQDTLIFLESNNTLDTGNINQGSTAIAATSINITCTAMIVDAVATIPNGIALRGIRFNPVPGSQE
jgi:hypothetical protein